MWTQASITDPFPLFPAPLVVPETSTPWGFLRVGGAERVCPSFSHRVWATGGGGGSDPCPKQYDLFPIFKQLCLECYSWVSLFWFVSPFLLESRAPLIYSWLRPALFWKEPWPEWIPHIAFINMSYYIWNLKSKSKVGPLNIVHSLGRLKAGNNFFMSQTLSLPPF